jgi:hypothetical protein
MTMMLRRICGRSVRAWACTGVVALAIAAAGCAAAPRTRPVRMGPVDQGPMTLEAARKYLQGRWSLTSYEIYPSGQPPITLKGEGTLTYDEFGNMDMEIRVPEAATVTLLEKAGVPVSGGVMASQGRTAIDMQARTLTYMMEGQGPLISSASAGPLALSRKRHWQVEGSTLTLTTQDDAGKPLSVGTWQKVP